MIKIDLRAYVGKVIKYNVLVVFFFGNFCMFLGVYEICKNLVT